MRNISYEEITKRIRFENPWWESGVIDDYFGDMKPRAYLDGLFKIITESDVRRAPVVLGPRRVGKTVMLYHVIQRLLKDGVDQRKICYVSIEAPVYIGLGLENMLEHYKSVFGFDDLKGCYVFFDEIQYLKNWEIHLKKLVDDYKDTVFIASGSAAAALRLKSAESGAGRFTNYHLPPLTFYEYLYLIEKDGLVTEITIEEERVHDGKISTHKKYMASDINALNNEFINYLNYGGYPEALFSESIKADPQRFIKSDIIDKVLMRDLPSLYGIQDIQELNRLFTMLAYNTGNEISLDELSQGANIAKNTIKKYLEYLEAAFLIKRLYRVDQSGKHFKRANYFKVYLTNPSMRCALFGPVAMGHEFLGNMAETAIYSQWLHASFIDDVHYARWGKGEIDFVFEKVKGGWVCQEVKWTNRFFDKPNELRKTIQFPKDRGKNTYLVTTIDRFGFKTVDDITVEFMETSLNCYLIGKLTTEAGSKLIN